LQQPISEHFCFNAALFCRRGRKKKKKKGKGKGKTAAVGCSPEFRRDYIMSRKGKEKGGRGGGKSVALDGALVSRPPPLLHL